MIGLTIDSTYSKIKTQLCYSRLGIFVKWKVLRFRVESKIKKWQQWKRGIKWSITNTDICKPNSKRLLVSVVRWVDPIFLDISIMRRSLKIESIKNNERYTVLEIFPNGKEIPMEFTGSEIRENYGNIFWAYLHAFIVREVSSQRMILVYTWHLPDTVARILSWITGSLGTPNTLIVDFLKLAFE